MSTLLLPADGGISSSRRAKHVSRNARLAASVVENAEGFPDGPRADATGATPCQIVFSRNQLWIPGRASSDDN